MTMHPGLPVSRRRAIRVLAAAGIALGSRPSLAGIRRTVWQGTALGASARLTLCGGDTQTAQRVLALCVDEIERLENQFSLYRQDSALSRLNRSGSLRLPSADMLALLKFSHWLGTVSNGAFDISVQPLWQCYARHFSQPRPDPKGPDAAALAAACRQVDHRRIAIRDDRIDLPTGMALTLNGIAQGYVTDRIADLLLSEGWTDVLVDMGEIRGLGEAETGRPWQVATPAGRIDLSQRAVATSAGSGSPFEPTGAQHHLLDPRSGRPSNHYAAMTVVASRATLADALSTMLSIVSPEEACALLPKLPPADVFALQHSGDVLTLS